MQIILIVFSCTAIILGWLGYFYTLNTRKDILYRPLFQQNSMPSINELAIIILTLPLWLIANLFRPLLTLLLQKKSSNKLEKKVVPVSTIYWSGDGYNGECLSGGQLNLHTDKGIGIELFCSEGAMSMPDTSFIYEGRNLYRGNLTKYLYYIRDEQKGSVVCKALHSSIKIEIRVTPTNPIVP